MLQKRFEVVTEAHAAAGRGALREGESFDVVLCDLMMPGDDRDERPQRHRGRRRPQTAARMIFMSGGACTPETADFVERYQGSFHREAAHVEHALGPLVGRLKVGT